MGGACVLALSMVSCDDYLDINTDPNNPTDASAMYQQRLAHIEFYTNSATQFGAWRNCMACGDWTRYYDGGTYYNMSLMYPTASITTTPYQWALVGAMPNIQDMITKADAAGNYLYSGAGHLLRSYIYILMTDLYGEMPYTDVANGSALPKYDTGRTIYLGCLEELDLAIEKLEAGQSQNPNLPTLAEGDFWAQGDKAKWLKLAYLLKARWLNKLNKKAVGSYTEGKYDVPIILACLDKAMQSNADNVIINHTDDNGTTHDVLGWNEPVDYSPLYSVWGGNGGYMPTAMLENNLTNFGGYGVEDPRADRILPWRTSSKSADSPVDLKWSTDGKWFRGKGVDMSSNIQGQGGPLRAGFSDGSWWVDSDAPERQNDTLYVESISESKGYAANVDLLYRRNGTDASKESGTFYSRVSSPTYLGTYAECCFIRAEILFKQGQQSEAFNWYKKGIQSSMEVMNEKLVVWTSEDPNLLKCPSFVPMTQDEMDNFLANGIGTSGAITLGHIMTQKRIAMHTSMEVWNDMRRYDYDPEVFFGYAMPAAHALNASAMKAIPEGKQFRRWSQCSHETTYNAENLQEIGYQVEGADMSQNWATALDVWTIPVWWDSTQE